MKLIDYIGMAIILLLLGGLFVGMLILPYLAHADIAYINATRYLSIGGKVAILLLTAGVFIFLLEFIILRDTKEEAQDGSPQAKEGEEEYLLW